MPFTALATATTPTAHIGLGLAAVGRPGYINLHRDQDFPDGRDVEDLRARTHELLDAAYAQGVRYVDAARSYGRAEEFLGSGWTPGPPSPTSSSAPSGGTPTPPTGAPRPRPTRSRTTASPPSSASAPRPANSSATGSTSTRSTRSPPTARPSPTRNSTSAWPPSPPTGSPSASPPAAPTRPTPSGPRSRSPSTATPLPYGPGHLQRPGDLGRPCSRRGPRGRADRDRQGGHGQRAAGRGRGTRRVPRDRRRRGVGGDAVALALVLHQPWAGVVLSGAATVTQLAGNLHAPVVDLDEEQRDRLEALVEEPESYWRHRAALPWH